MAIPATEVVAGYNAGYDVGTAALNGEWKAVQAGIIIAGVELIDRRTPGNVPISMDTALRRADDFLDSNLPIRIVDGPTSVQFIQQTTDASGNAITRRVGLDVNPNSSHVQQLGPHLNLQTQINRKPVKAGPLADPHTPIIPSTVRSGDF